MANIKWSAFPSGADMQVGDQTVGLRGGLNYRFDFPSTGIKNATGEFLLSWNDVGAAAANYLQVSNSISGNPVLLYPLGTDADIGLTLSGKGAGVVTVSSNLILNTSAPTLALQAASKGYVDSLIPSFPISLAHGGTSASLTASNGGIFYSSSTAGAILSGTATATQMLQSGSSAAPAWSTSTWPATTTINQLLYSSAANTVSGLATGNSGTLVTSNTGIPSILATPGTTGNVLSSNAALAPSWSTAMYANTYTANNILYASSTNSVMGLATGNNGILITSGAGVPSISSTLPSAVQLNITSLGTISTGTWQGSIINSTYGGTGVNNGGSTFTYGGNTAFSGSFTFTGTLTGNTAVTFPTSGTLATTSQIPSLPLSLANGGTNMSNTASNGGIVYSTASALTILVGTSTANQIILSGSNTTPAWSTATYPATTTINQLLYSSAANTITGLATVNSAHLLTNTTGVPTWSATMTNGQVIIGSTGNIPSAATLTAGSGISITNGAGTITIASSTSGMIWSTVTGTTQSAAVNNGYITNNAGAVTVTLPTTFAIGDEIEVKGLGAGGWVLAAGTATIIRIGSSVTSSAGSLTSANRYDTVKVIGLEANATWSVDYAFSAGLTVA